MTKARDLIENRVMQVLNDLSAEHWTISELLGYLNEGLQQSLTYVPEQFSAVETLTLAAGSRQTLPSGRTRLLGIERNTSGDQRAPRSIAMSALPAAAPLWHAGTALAEVRQYAYDPAVPDVFWCAPPVSSGVQVEAIVAVQPDALQINQDIPIDSRYDAALANYVLYRAMSKDSEVTSPQHAQFYYTSYLRDFGVVTE